MQGTDYWDIGQVPAGTLADGTTTLLAVTGCAPDPHGVLTVNDELVDCPMGYTAGAGNLSLWVAKLDTSTPLDGGSIGAQFAYASYPFSLVGTLGGSVGSIAGFYLNTSITITPDAGAPPDGGDAGDAAIEAAAPVVVPVTVPFPIAEGVGYGQLAPTTSFPVSGVTFDGTSGFFVNSVAADGGAVIIHGQPLSAGLPLPAIQALSAPTADAGIFANGAKYVFVLVGNPNEPPYLGADGGATGPDAGQFNLSSLHILGFPSNPPFGN